MFSLPHGSPNRAAVAPEIELRIEPNTLRFKCPNTGREVDSGINKPWNTRLISIRVRCPICEKPHEWQVADGSFSSITYQPSSAILVAPEMAAAAGEENPTPPASQNKSHKDTQTKKRTTRGARRRIF